MSDFDNIQDVELCRLANSGCEEAVDVLLTRHRSLVRSCIRPYFLVGGDREDLLQEGMLGLLSAVRHFEPGHSTKFSTYARYCIHNRILSAVRSDSGRGNQPLNEYISLESEQFAQSYDVGSYDSDPEMRLIEKEGFAEIVHRLNAILSEFESRVLSLYLDGKTYREIAQETGKSEKSIDNAVQRIRKKLSQQIKSGEYSNS